MQTESLLIRMGIRDEYAFYYSINKLVITAMHCVLPQFEEIVNIIEHICLGTINKYQ